MHGRKRFRIGVFVVNAHSDGFIRWRLTSWGIEIPGIPVLGLFTIGPFSWNSRTRRERVDLPGPWSYSTGSKRR